MIAATTLVLLLMCSGVTKADAQDQTGCGLVANKQTKIVGGADVEIDDYPWQVALELCLPDDPITTSPPPASCGGYYNSPGLIVSPNYPSNYENNADCTYVLRNENGGRGVLNFTFIDIEGDRNYCAYDKLSIYDGPDTNSQLLEVLCGNVRGGNKNVIYNSTGDSLTLHFTSDGSVTRRGFVAFFNFSDSTSTSPTTPSTINITETATTDSSTSTMASDSTTTSSRPRNCRFNCGGSLIAPTWVLTAAHCTKNKPAGNLRIVAGVTNHNEEADDDTIYLVKDVFENPSYCRGTHGVYSDVALLELERPVDMEKSKTICLPTSNQDFSGETCVISGWGRLGPYEDFPTTLQAAKVTVGDWEICRSKLLGSGMEERLHLCAGNFTDGGVDTCSGDSGGPLACQQKDGRWTLAGVTSYGSSRGCGSKESQGIYARVSAFLGWISDVINSKHDMISVQEGDKVPPINQYQTVNFTCRPRQNTTSDNTTDIDRFSTTEIPTFNLNYNLTMKSHLGTTAYPERSNADITWHIRTYSYGYPQITEVGSCSEMMGGCMLDNGAEFPLWSVKYRFTKDIDQVMCRDEQGTVAVWNLTVLVPPENMNCTTLTQTSSYYGPRLFVQCTVLNVFPENRWCHLTVYSEESGNYTDHYSRLRYSYNYEYDGSGCRKPLNCGFSLTAEKSSGLGRGRNAFNVTLFSNSSQIKAHPSGQNMTSSPPDVTVSMPSPSLDRCPYGTSYRVINGSYVWLPYVYYARCYCEIETKNSSFSPGFANLSVTVGGNKKNVSSMHRLDIERNSTGPGDQLFECFATSSFFPGRSPSVYKTVKFAYGPNSSTEISLSRTDMTSSPTKFQKCPNATIQMTCRVTGVVPKAEIVVRMFPQGTVSDVTCASPDVCTYSFIPRSTGRHEFECQTWNTMFAYRSRTWTSSPLQVEVSEFNPTGNVPLLLIDGNRYQGAKNQIREPLTSDQSIGVSCYIEDASFSDITISCAGIKITNGKFTPTRRDDGRTCKCYLATNGNCPRVTTEVTLAVKEDENNESNDNNNNNNNSVIIGSVVAGSVVLVIGIFAFFQFWRR